MKTHFSSFVLDDELMTMLEYLKREHGQSRSWVMRRALREYFANQEKRGTMPVGVARKPGKQAVKTCEEGGKE